MLDSFRAATQSWFGRSIMAILLGLIILSFAIWGIGDIFHGFGADNLAKVGNVEITVTEYRNSYQDTLQRLQRQARRGITNEEARQFGLDRQVLSRLVNDAALDQKAQELGLAMSDEEMTKIITEDPAFLGPTGRFDRQKFEALLRDNGLSERTFVRQQRGIYLRHQISDALTHGIEIPKTMLLAIHRFQAERRNVDYIYLPPASVGDVAAPTQQQIEKYFEDRRKNYSTPEYRKLVTLSLTPSSLAKPDQVSDADAQKRYDEVKNERFGAPEKRAIEQILFPDEASAKAARAELDAGKTFDDLLKEKGVSPKDASLGTLTRDGLVDKNVADAAFALPEGGVSAPVKAQFGSVLLRVTKITPSSLKPFSEAAGDLKREIAQQRARAEVDRLHDAIEDQRTAGESLTEAAKSVNLEPRVIASISAAGAGPDGAPAAPDLPNAAALLKAAFASDVGVDNDTLRTTDGGFQWFEVAEVQKARDKTLDEVKPQVEKAWRDEEAARLLAEKAAALTAKINAGEPLASIAAAEGHLEVKHANNLTRQGGEGLPNSIIPEIFNIGPHGAGSAQMDDGSRMIFTVVDAVVPPIDYDGADLAAIRDAVRNGIIDDVSSEYLTKLENDLGVKVNGRALAAVTGGSADLE